MGGGLVAHHWFTLDERLSFSPPTFCQDRP